MFISDEVRAEVSPVAATARLAALARGTSLIQASRAAWATAAAAGRGSAEPGHAMLTGVLSREPVQHGATMMLILRWEAADDSGQSYPALDADITLIPDGEHAVLIGLSGVGRLPSREAGSGRPAPHAAAVRALLNRIAEAVSEAEPAHGRPPATVSSKPGDVRHGPVGTSVPAGSRGGERTVLP